MSCTPKTLTPHLEINTGKLKGSSQRQENRANSPERRAGWSPAGAAEREGGEERPGPARREPQPRALLRARRAVGAATSPLSAAPGGGGDEREGIGKGERSRAED